MSMGVMTEDGYKGLQVGEVATSEIKRLEALIDENRRAIQEIRELKAGLNSYGLSKICPTDVTDATEDNGMVLGAGEKDASIAGTLANLISSMAEKYENVSMLKSYFREVKNDDELQKVLDELTKNEISFVSMQVSYANNPIAPVAGAQSGGRCLIISVAGGPKYAYIVCCFIGGKKLAARSLVNGTWLDWVSLSS